MTVLNIVRAYSGLLLVSWILGMLSFALFMWNSFTISEYGRNIKNTMGIVFGIVAAVMCIATGVYVYNTPHYKYQVALDEGNSVFDLQENYDILSEDGDIYTVIAKDG